MLKILFVFNQGDCGGNYSGQEADIITSPNYPGNYSANLIERKSSIQPSIVHIAGKYHGPGKGLASRACNWYITARFGYRISMNFEFFSVEGDPACEFQFRFLQLESK